MKKILVTGADGFIGSHIVDSLVKSGYEVKAFVLYNSFNSYGWLDKCDQSTKSLFDVYAGDIRDSFCVRKAMKDCETVIHLASLIGIPYSYNSPEAYVDTNIKGTLNILQAARDLNIKKVIHTSTSEVYGTAKFVPISEDHPLRGQSPYSASKIAADQIAYSYYTSFDLPVITLRPFNTYGPRQSARAIIPTVITQLANRRKNINLGSLHPTRDFNYVKDIVKGFISALKCENAYGEVINLGSNFEISIGETVNLISKIMDIEVEVKEEKIRKRPKNSEVERLWADNSKAKNILGWEPQFKGIEGFERGLRETIIWFMDKENLKGYKDIYNI
jgi:NAD dependent epimerase/dehydratase